MNFHDRLARKAHEMGHKAEAFQALAQSKAGAFWLYLAITGVVWWFAYGFLWLIPAAFAGWRAWESVTATRVQVRLMTLEQNARPHG